jgi:polygalacturonase
VFPSGFNFLSGPIVIESSNTALLIEPGCRLVAINTTSKWPTSAGAFITSNHVGNLAIYGGGTVDGQGAVWWPNKNGFRPEMVYISNAANVLITNITFVDSPNHNLEMYSNYTEIAFVTILAPGDSPNTDAVV